MPRIARRSARRGDSGGSSGFGRSDDEGRNMLWGGAGGGGRRRRAAQEGADRRVGRDGDEDGDRGGRNRAHGEDLRLREVGAEQEAEQQHAEPRRQRAEGDERER